MEDKILSFEEVSAKYPSLSNNEEYMKFSEEANNNRDKFFDEATKKVVELRDFILEYQAYLDDGPAIDGYLITRDALVENLSKVDKLLRDEYGRQLANEYLSVEF